jgi:trk system potassium uptake protein TrkA
MSFFLIIFFISRISKIIRPEEETAERWVKKLISSDVNNSFELTDGNCFTEIEVPKRFIGLSVADLDLLNTHNIIVLSRKIKKVEKSLLGVSREIYKDQGIAKSSTVFTAEDRIVIYGTDNDVKKFLQKKF